MGSYPAYFTRLGELNRHGPLVATAPTLVAMDATTVRRLLADGGSIVDVRPVAAYAAGHLPGSVSIPLRPQYATWLGWLLPPDVPIVVLRNPDQDPAEILWAALIVGYAIAGELAGGIAAWDADGGQLATTRLVGPSGVDTLVVDVRQASELADRHLPGARLIELGRLTEQAADLPEQATTVICGHGERAATAASLLERAGHRQLSILDGGPEDWAAATGRSLDTRS